MSRILNKRNIFKTIFAVWIVLWIFFLIREDKDGQYRSLGYLYTHGYNDKVRYVLGDELYDFLIFCRQQIPEGSSYELVGFKKFSIYEVRARYFLWPLRHVKEDPDFKIVYEGQETPGDGYREYKRYGAKGRLLAREDTGG
ncbi:MAG: hypothetical protein ABID83_02585 [Candidatus Omnitrophota bacterium]